MVLCSLSQTIPKAYLPPTKAGEKRYCTPNREPAHWGFVTLGWCGLFGAGGGVAAQIVSQMSNLAGVIWNNAPKSILDLCTSQVNPDAKVGY